MNADAQSNGWQPTDQRFLAWHGLSDDGGSFATIYCDDAFGEFQTVTGLERSSLGTSAMKFDESDNVNGQVAPCSPHLPLSTFLLPSSPPLSLILSLSLSSSPSFPLSLVCSESSLAVSC